MINIKDFILFLSNSFEPKQLMINEFKPGLWFAEIDCFAKQAMVTILLFSSMV
jgi:hypothetical protein